MADIVDRRQVLIVAQVWMAASAACLALLGFLGLLGPAGLLLLTFALGIGTALNGPAWQAAVREIVPSQDLAAAVTLNAIAFNIARAVGPALGGILIAASGAETAFIVNAVSSLAMIAAMLVWRRDLPKEDLPRERLGSAMITGLRYVTETPPIRAVLVRGAAFGTLAAAIMALLPLIARDRLGGDATLYGLLLGAFGVGALIGAFMIHRVRQAKGAEFVITLLTAVFGARPPPPGPLPLAASPPPSPCRSPAPPGSAPSPPSTSASRWSPPPGSRPGCWPSTRASSSAAWRWARWVWGHLAAYTGLDMAQVIVGALLLATLLLHFRYPMPAAEAVDLRPMASRGTDPKPAVPFRYEEGPVLVMIEYRVPESNTAAFMAAMEDVGHMRKRDGAWRWNLFEDTADARLWIETFTLGSWFDYLRQRRRGTEADEAIITRAGRWWTRSSRRWCGG